MKKIIILALTALMMVGCKHQEVKTQQNQLEYDYSVIIVDGCEYIEKSYRYDVGSKYGAMAGYLAHKGNCRFCKERRKQELDALVEQIKEK